MSAQTQKSKSLPLITKSPSESQDCGKEGVVLVDSVSGYPLKIILCDELGADSKNHPEFLARAKRAITYHRSESFSMRIHTTHWVGSVTSVKNQEDAAAVAAIFVDRFRGYGYALRD